MEEQVKNENALLSDDQNNIAFYRKCRNWFIFFIILWFVVWTVMPAFLLKNACIDVLENIVWSRHFAFGYDKNPYFGAWITRAGYWLSGNKLWSANVLCQISVALGFFAIWKLAREIVNPFYALISVLLLSVIQFYSVLGLEFNDDVIEISLWALICLFFYKALKKQKVFSWIMVGIFAGLAFMTKYYGLVLFLPMVIIAIFTREGRISFKKAGLYISIIVFLILSLPNLIWLHGNNFVAVTYAMDRAQISTFSINNLLQHIIQPALYLLSMFGVFIIPVILCIVCFSKRTAKHANYSRFNWIFITTLCFGPILTTTLISCTTGADIRYMWATPVFNLLGIFIVMSWQPELTRKRIKRFGFLIAIFFVFWIGKFCRDSLFLPYMRGKGDYTQYPGKHIAEDITKRWRKKYNIPVKYIVGNRELTCDFAVYSPDQPTAYFSAETSLSPWVTDAMVIKSGGVFAWEGELAEKIKKEHINRFSGLQFYPTVSYDWSIVKWFSFLFKDENILKPVKITYAFLPPPGKY